MRQPVWVTSLGRRNIEGLEKELDDITSRGTEFLDDATIEGEALPSEEMRKSKIKFLKNPRIHEMVTDIFRRANKEVFGFDTDYVWDMQYTEYSADRQDHFDWHLDVDWGSQLMHDRKLSMSIQLSDSDEYEGGDLEFEGLQAMSPAQLLEQRQKGLVIVFPSYMKHRVTELTKGSRKALVCWMEGPRWR
jgi:PKHD-type hydroxylase